MRWTVTWKGLFFFFFKPTEPYYSWTKDTEDRTVFSYYTFSLAHCTENFESSIPRVSKTLSRLCLSVGSNR